LTERIATISKWRKKQSKAFLSSGQDQQRIILKAPCLDKGYDYDEVRDIFDEFGYTAHIRARGEEAQDLKKKTGRKARRWVVERTHSWMNRFRGLLIRWSKKPENYLALLHLSCAYIAYGQARLLG